MIIEEKYVYMIEEVNVGENCLVRKALEAWEDVTSASIRKEELEKQKPDLLYLIWPLKLYKK